MTRRLIPFLFVLYIACFLDRVNVGFAALQMNADLGFTSRIYGFGAGIFFLGYALLEVPSNLLLARVGARRWIARIMISWGILASAMMFVRGPTSFYVLRLLLGIAEAGFFPGIIFYLSEWYPAAERSRAIARFMTAIPISGVLGGPISGALLGLHGLLGLRGWQWLFLIEGLPAVLLGVAVLRWLPDTPAHARWLAPEQRDWLVQRLRTERESRDHRHGLSVAQALRNGTIWQLALLIFFGAGLGQYTLAFWMPQIVKELGGLSDFAVGVVSAVPYLAAAIAMVLVGIRSDRSGERALYVAMCCVTASLGFLLSAYVHSSILAIVALSITAAGLFSFHGPFWTLPSLFLSGSAAAGAIALINSSSALSGFLGPYIIGLMKWNSGDFRSGFLVMGGASAFGAMLALYIRRAPRLAAASTTAVGAPSVAAS